MSAEHKPYLCSYSEVIDTRRIPPWLDAVLIGTTALSMLLWTWMTWPDPLVDFGRELYVPWQLSEGRQLYVDIAYHNGPLSPYLNRAWFGLFGVSLQSLVVGNLLLLSVWVPLLYAMFRCISGRIGAFFACLTFLTLFAFSQFTIVGNYNWVCPYSHEMTHGIGLALAAVFVLSYATRESAVRHAVAAGFLAGLVSLTKCEVFVAVAAGLGVHVLLMAWAWRAQPTRVVAVAAALLAGLGLALLLSFLGLWLGAGLPAGDALHGTLGAWVYVAGQGNLAMPFFKWCTGLDTPGANAVAMLRLSCGYAIAVGAILALAQTQAGSSARGRVVAGAVAFCAVLCGLWAARFLIPWEAVFRPLPVIILAVGVVALVDAFRGAAETRGLSRTQALRCGLFVLAFVLLLKMLLKARIAHYGFGLAMPATLLLAVLLLEWLPALSRRLGGSGGVALAGLLGLWMAVVAVQLTKNRNYLEIKHYVTGIGRDAFVSDGRGQRLQAALHGVLAHVPPDKTLITLPANEMLNFLARRRNPLRYGNFNPHQIRIFGEEKVLASFQATPPDFLVFQDDRFVDYGAEFFGRDFAQKLAEWLHANYRVKACLAPRPVPEARYGMLLLERGAPETTRTGDTEWPPEDNLP